MQTLQNIETIQNMNYVIYTYYKIKVWIGWCCFSKFPIQKLVVQKPIKWVCQCGGMSGLPHFAVCMSEIMHVYVHMMRVLLCDASGNRANGHPFNRTTGTLAHRLRCFP